MQKDFQIRNQLNCYLIPNFLQLPNLMLFLFFFFLCCAIDLEMLAILVSYIKFIYEVFRAVYRDILGTLLLIRTRRRLTRFQQEKSNVYNEFCKLARTQPDKACIIFNDHTWTFKDVIS